MAVRKRCNCGAGLEKAKRWDAWRRCEHPYYLYPKFKGHSYPPKVLETSSLSAAQDIEAKVLAELQRSHESGVLARARASAGEGVLTIESLIERDRKAAVLRGGRDGEKISDGYLESGLDNGYRAIRYYVEHIQKTKNKTLKPSDITKDLILDYASWRRSTILPRLKRGRHGKPDTLVPGHKIASPNTAAREVTIWKRLLNDAAECGQAMPLIKQPKVGKGKPNRRLMGANVPEDVRNSFFSYLPQDPRDLWELALYTGWRDGHLHKLDEAFFEQTDLGVFARFPGDVLKNREDEYLPVSEEAWKILKRRIGRRGMRVVCVKCGALHTRRPQACHGGCETMVFERREVKLPIFEDVSYEYWHRMALRKMEAERAAKGLPPYGDTITLRDMRTTFENQLLEAGIDPTTVMTLMTHSDLSMVARYSRERMERLQLGVAAASSRAGVQNRGTNDAGEGIRNEVNGLGNRLTAGQRTLTRGPIADSPTILPESLPDGSVVFPLDPNQPGYKLGYKEVFALGFAAGVASALGLSTKAR